MFIVIPKSLIPLPCAGHRHSRLPRQPPFLLSTPYKRAKQRRDIRRYRSPQHTFRLTNSPHRHSFAVKKTTSCRPRILFRVELAAHCVCGTSSTTPASCGVTAPANTTENQLALKSPSAPSHTPTDVTYSPWQLRPRPRAHRRARLLRSTPQMPVHTL